MEYLVISGAVRLKSNISSTKIQALLKSIASIDFVMDGYVDIHHDKDYLYIEAEGTIGSSIEQEVDYVFNLLAGYVTEESTVSVSRIRCEVTVLLGCNERAETAVPVRLAS